MNEIEALRAEVQQLRIATRNALALTNHCLAVQQDAKLLLAVLMANADQAMKGKDGSDALDELLTAALLAVSSVALKQWPDDPDVKRTYQGLRDGTRH